MVDMPQPLSTPSSPEEPRRGRAALDLMANGAAVNYARSPILAVVFDRLVRQFAGSLRTLSGSAAELTVHPAESLRFEEYLNDLPRPCLIAVAKSEALGGSLLVTLDAGLILAIVDILLGGRRSGPDEIANRPFSSIEQRLAEKLMGVVLEDLADAFAPLIPLNFEIDRLETEPQFALITRGTNPCLRMAFDVEIEGRHGAVAMLVPHATLEPVRDKLTQLFFGEGLTHDPQWKSHIGRELNHAHVRLQAVLTETRLPVDEVLQWRPGSLVKLGITGNAVATVTCDEIPMFRAEVGQRNGTSAVEITETIDPEETLCDVLPAR